MNEQTVFTEALEREDPIERAAFLDQACRGDPDLRDRIGRLLALHERVDELLDSPPESPSTSHDDPIAEGPGSLIGPYKLLELVGEGGFGVVFRAEQTAPIRRKVALKILKPGMDTRHVIARFEAERQALAIMDHPNIARVFDGGATPSGRPYFVMEYVKGAPITDFCDQNRFTLRQRLDLFIHVCQAVQHAHQKGIIHRDLKPSNVLVSRHDATPVVKVIDFGVAKALGQVLTDRTLFTGATQMIGTPLYMSPEQAGMSDLDVDTRSDVYSLGVLLYELLTGTTPITRERFKQAEYDEIRWIIREEDPPTPSTRLSSVKSLPNIAANRGIEPRKLSGLLRGELDWVVMKALEKDRSRRYETASAFASDLQHYLLDEPVQACAPTTWYRLRKFARRNRVVLAAASFVVAALAAGAAIATWQAFVATQARADAVKETLRADRQAALATKISLSLKQLLSSLNPDAAKGPNYTARQLLDDFEDDLEKSLAEEPEAAAELHTIVGRAYACVGERVKAEKHLRRALELHRGLRGENHEEYLGALVEYSRPDAHEGLPQLAKCESDLRRALSTYRSLGVEGPPVVRALWMLRWNLIGQSHAGKPAKGSEIEPVVMEALKEAAKTPGVEFPEIPSLKNALVGVRLEQGRALEAEQLAHEVIATCSKSNRSSGNDAAWGHAGLGSALTRQHKYSKAFDAHKTAIAIMRKVVPPGHATIAYLMAGAGRTLEEATAAKALASVFPSTTELGNWEAILRDVLATTPAAMLSYGDPIGEAIENLVRLADLYEIRAKELDAEGHGEAAKAMRNETGRLSRELQGQLSGRPELLAYYYCVSATSALNAGRTEEVKNFGRRLLALGSPKTLHPMNSLAWDLVTAKDPTRRDPTLAAELARKVIDIDPRQDKGWQTLGWAEYRRGNWRASLEALERSCEFQSHSKGGEAWQWFGMSMAQWRLGDRDEARRQYQRAVEWTERFQPGAPRLRRLQAEAAEVLGVERKGK